MTVASVRSEAQSFVSWVERWVSAATLIDWIAIGAGCGALFVAWRLLTAPVRLGPIEVSASDTEATSTDFGRAEVATMRRELARWGLVPAAGVPAGSPTANIAAAVEASPLAYGKFLSALIALIPLPPRSTAFKVTATLTEYPQADQPWDLTYQLTRQDTRATLEIDTVTAADKEEAIVAAAGRAFRRIAESGDGIFPPWSHWPNVESMLHYRSALECERARDWAGARRSYAAAAAEAPDNMLARLRGANCLERQAGNAASNKRARALRLQALNLYRSIAAREPDIFEPRYRSSILLSRLADALVGAKKPVERIVPGLGAVVSADQYFDAETLETRLRGLARKEARAARRLLYAFTTLWRHRRLRHRLELRGSERRRTLRALRISRLCLRVRDQWSSRASVPWGIGELRRFWWRLRLRKQFVPREENAGWQAHYNAACFYALLPEVAAPLPSGAPFSALPRAALQRRALKHLRAALRDPKRDLSCEYVRTGDPDLVAIRSLREWTDTLAAFCGREAILLYERRDRDYDGWGLYVWGDGVAPAAVCEWPESLRGKDEGDGRIMFRVPLAELSSPVRVIVHRAGTKDLPDDREFRPLEQAQCTFWLYDDDPEIHLSARPTPNAAAAANAAPHQQV